MGESNVNLAELIGSRICHDLISPIGAITNGLELLDLSGAARGPEMQLISESVGNAGARIRFFRIAFGTAGDQELSRADMVSLLAEVTRNGRIRMQWQAEGAAPRKEVKAALLALLCCENALPMGGNLSVSRHSGNWTVQGTGPKIAPDPGLWDFLAAGCPPARVSPAQVQFALLPEAARACGRDLETQRHADTVSIRF